MKTNWPALWHGYLMLLSMALASSPVLAQTPGGATATTAVISSVAITQAPQRSAVRVEGEGRLDVHAGRMHNPDRLVLDFAGARLAVEKTGLPGVCAHVREVRVHHRRVHGARVVVHLTAPPPCGVPGGGDADVNSFGPPATPRGGAVQRMTSFDRNRRLRHPCDFF